MGERLYNGIRLPDDWPPRDVDLACGQPQRVPYLEKPPAVIDIDVGRQLFVDDFLIGDATAMDRQFMKPVKYPANPVFFPQTHDELRADFPPCAVTKSGGVWYDDTDKRFKMWYMSGYLGHASYAESVDGVHWERPELDVVPGTNHFLPRDVHPDSGSVIVDDDAPAAERFKLLLREPDPPGRQIPGRLFVSGDGKHWREVAQTGVMGDRSTMFLNPFRRKWVQSIRSYVVPGPGRTRHYFEADDFANSAHWRHWENTAPWCRADILDPSQGDLPQLYNLDAIAYESLMVGFPQICKGPPNHIGEQHAEPKLTELTAAYSRDGFHWFRPDRTPFLGARREAGSWEFGYIESCSGMVHVVGDELWIYYNAYAGDPSRRMAEVKERFGHSANDNTSLWFFAGLYGHGAVGLAKMRRDGFAAMCGRFPGADMTTRPVRFSGDHFFVNGNTAGLPLRVEVLDIERNPQPGFSGDDVLPWVGNSTKREIRWKGGSLGTLAGKPVRFRFQMDRGELYSFWVSTTPEGHSNGYVGAGGPGFKTHRDVPQ